MVGSKQKQETLDFYKVLEVNETATIEEIKKSYRCKVLKYHPDLNKNNPLAVKMLQNVIKAYKTLSDPEKRIEYDKNIKNFKIYTTFPDLKKNNTNGKPKKNNKVKKKKKEEEINTSIFKRIKIGFRIFRTKISNTFNKLPDLIVADKKLLKIPVEELRQRFYKSENKYVRCEALKALAVLIGKKAYLEIERGLGDISKDVRLVSIYAVGYLSIRQGLKYLERLYSTTASTALRKAVVVSASRFNNDRSRRLIVNACQDKDCDIRLEALKTFKRLNMGEYINKISYLVYDRNDDVRRLARELYETHKELR